MAYSRDSRRRPRGRAGSLALAAGALFLSVPVLFLPARASAKGPDTGGRGDTALAGPAWVLLRTDSRARGLPGFGPNAFEALAGDYRLAPEQSPGGSPPAATGHTGARFFVWASREALWFSPDRWTAGPVWSLRGSRLRPSRRQSASARELPAFAAAAAVSADGPAPTSTADGPALATPFGAGPAPDPAAGWIIYALETPFTFAGEGGRPGDWSLFFAFAADLAPALRDETISMYLERFASFLERAKRPEEVSLPALPAREP